MILALCTAIALGVIAMMLLRGGGTRGSAAGVVNVGERVLDFAPSGVSEVQISNAASTARIVRITGEGALKPPAWAPDAEWLLVSDSAGASVWPIPSPQMQGFLRTIAEARAVATPQAGASIGDSPTIVTLLMRGGPAKVLRLSSRTLAGTGLVELSEKPLSGTAPTPATLALIGDELHRACMNPGPSAWRDRAILRSLAPDASRVTLTSGSRALALAKLDGQWVLREPVAAPADPAAVVSLLGALSKVQVVEFSDKVPAGVKTGIESPTSRLTLEVDRRTLAPDPSAPVKLDTITLNLAIGAPANADAARVFASLDGKTPLLLDAAALATLSVDPAGYLWTGAIKCAPADVTKVRLRTGDKVREFVRADTRWNERTDAPGGPGTTALTPQDAGEVESLIVFLTGASVPERGGQTDRPKIAVQDPGGLKPVGAVSVWLGSSQLPEIELFSGTGDGLTLRSGPVYRTFADKRLPALLKSQPVADGAEK